VRGWSHERIGMRPAASVCSQREFWDSLLAALFFLTRGPEVRVWCVEADPANVRRLRVRLARFSDRVRVIEAAVCAEPQLEVRFVPSGRYGHVADTSTLGTITVAGLAIGDLLARVLDEAGRVDLVKIDTEGTEEALVDAVPAHFRPRIGALVYEGPSGSVCWAWS